MFVQVKYSESEIIQNLLLFEGVGIMKNFGKILTE